MFNDISRVVRIDIDVWRCVIIFIEKFIGVIV